MLSREHGYYPIKLLLIESSVTLVATICWLGPLDDTFPDISRAVFVFHDQPVFVVEFDIRSS